ncbi:thioredoxin family protein [Streptacidiphilus jiangxiensis]|uniref:Thioredoxin-like n=1 Tax=Streptacidiphilus jiangxiensis TaxID=235985 RepID=A0A1H7QK62_STRJI|nr:thioredoxin family protein [Streptacidiphilus jiangxiensis]SEL48510.1 Thioredoxin-like [Streptacidiphilus jiangxiensis]
MRQAISVFTAAATFVLAAGCASPVTASTVGAAQPSVSVTASVAGAPTTAPAVSNATTQHPTSPRATKRPTARPAASHRTTQPASSVPTSFGYSPSANAQAQIDAARAAARADGKEVLLDFGATWCGNCVAMDEDFRTSQVRAVLGASYHLVQIDIGDNVDANMRILGRYDAASNFALPVIIILSPSGTIRVDTNKTGNPAFDQAGFLAFLKKWAA